MCTERQIEGKCVRGTVRGGERVSVCAHMCVWRWEGGNVCVCDRVKSKVCVRVCLTVFTCV